MGAKRFYAAASITALVMIPVFIALYFTSPSAASSVLSAQPAANMPAETTPVATTTKTSGQSQSHDHGTGMVLSNPNARADMPAFTEQDVRDYVLKYDSKGFFKIIAVGASPQITSIRFGSLSETETGLHTSLGSQVSPDTLLCSVTFDGNFVVSSPFAERHFSHAAQFFNAHTGEVMEEIAFNDK